MSLRSRNPKFEVPTSSDTNRSVQSQNQARSLKFWIKVEERFYYPFSENKGADQLRSYCTADLRLCVWIFRVLAFWCGSSYCFMFCVLFGNDASVVYIGFYVTIVSYNSV